MSINLPKALRTVSNLSTEQGNFKSRIGLQMSDRINHNRRRFLAPAAMTAAAVPFGVTGCAVQRMTRALRLNCRLKANCNSAVHAMRSICAGYLPCNKS
jgi:hypothetical protein